MTKPRYLVTGGLGFIGSEFVRRSDVEVHVVDVDSYAGDEQRLSMARHPYGLTRADVNSNEFKRFVTDWRPDVIVHFAAETHVTRSETQEELFQHVNVEGTRAVLEAAVEAGTGLVLHVSTDEVYGPAG